MGGFAPISQGLRLIMTLSSLLCGFQRHSNYHRPDKARMGEGGRPGSETSSQAREEIAASFTSPHFPLARASSHGHIQLQEKLGNSVSTWTVTSQLQFYDCGRRRETDFNKQRPDSGQRIRQDDRSPGPVDFGAALYADDIYVSLT